MLYFWLKITHIFSAALLLTGLIYCFKFWKQNRTNTTAILEQIQKQNWSMIIPFATVQLITGFSMISIKHYTLSEQWLSGSVIAFISLIISWFAFIYFLLMAQHSKQQKLFRRLQSIMLIIGAGSLLNMIFFMANRMV